MSPPDATWRVYLAEWLIVWTSDAFGPEGAGECRAHFGRRYKGRVREEDWRVEPAVPGRVVSGQQCLQLRLPNLQGEFKLRADVPVTGYVEGGHLVQRGSAEEKELLAYGKKMLPDAG